jgi:hypothetical protein
MVIFSYRERVQSRIEISSFAADEENTASYGILFEKNKSASMSKIMITFTVTHY